MAEVDSLEVKIESSADAAVRSLDKIVERLGLVASGISAITKGHGLDEFAKMAQESTKEFTKFSGAAKNVSTQVGAQIKNLTKEMADFAKIYEGLGENFQLKGDTKYLQKQVDKLSNKLAYAELQKQSLEKSGKTEGKEYGDAVKYVIMYGNQIASLQKQIAGMEDAKPKLDFDSSRLEKTGRTLESFREQLAGFKGVIDAGGSETESGITFPVSGLQLSLEMLRDMYPQAKELISDYEDQLKRATSLSSRFPVKSYGNVDLSAFERIGDKAKEFTDLKVNVSGIEESRQEIEGFSSQIQNMKDLFSQTFSDIKSGELWNYLSNGVKSYVKEAQKAAGTKVYTDDYKVILDDIQRTEGALDRLNRKKRDVEASGLGEESEEWKKVATEISAAERRLDSYTAKRKEMESSGSDVRSSGGVFGQGLGKTSGSLLGISDIFNKSGKAVGGLSSGILRLGKSFRGLGKSHSIMNGSFLGGFKTFLKYSLSIRSLYALVNKLKSVTSEGFQNLAQYSNEVNSSLSMLKSSLNATKNSLAVAFAPVLNAVAPYLSALIDMVTRAANSVGQFFAILTGKKYAVQAVKSYEDFTAGISGVGNAVKDAVDKAKAGVRAFDELNTISLDKGSGAGSGGGSGAGGAAIEDMFTTVEVEKDISDFAEKIKAAWRKSDFTEIGEIIGSKLKEGLDGINWDAISEKCQKIAKSIGTLINGFIGTEGLAESIGKTIGSAINTGICTVNTFLKTTDFHAIGNFLAEAANNAIKTTDFSMVGETVANGLKAAVGTWYSFVTTFDFKGLGSKIGSSLKSFFNDMGKVNKATGLTGWQELGASLSGTVDGLIVALKEALSELPWEDVGQAIADFITGIDWGQIVLDFSGLAYEIYKGLITALMVFPFEFISGNLAKLLTGEEINWNEALENGKQVKEDMESFLEKYPGLTETDFYNFKSGVDLSSVKSPVIGESANKKRDAAIQKLKNDTQDKKTGKTATNGLIAGATKQLAELPPIGITVEGKPGAEKLMEPYVDYADKNSLSTDVLTKNTPKDVQLPFSAYFLKNQLISGVGTSNNGEDVHDYIQGGFGKKDFYTGSRLTNTGTDLNNEQQRTFGQKKFYTTSYLLNTGAELALGLQRTFGQNSLGIGAYVTTSGRELYDQIASKIASVGAIGVSIGLNAVSAGRRAVGGIFEGGKWKDIPQYGSGGNPDHGTLFWAGEAGAEVVGHMNGRTEVLNRSQLASTMYRAVVSGIKAVMPKKIDFTIPGFKDGMESLYKSITVLGNNLSQGSQFAVNPEIYAPRRTFASVGREIMNDIREQSANVSYSGNRQDKMEEIFYRATYNAVSSAINNNKTLGDILDEVKNGHTIEMNGKRVAETVRGVANEHFRTSGNPYFAY